MKQGRKGVTTWGGHVHTGSSVTGKARQHMRNPKKRRQYFALCPTATAHQIGSPKNTFLCCLCHTSRIKNFLTIFNTMNKGLFDIIHYVLCLLAIELLTSTINLPNN